MPGNRSDYLGKVQTPKEIKEEGNEHFLGCSAFSLWRKQVSLCGRKMTEMGALFVPVGSREGSIWGTTPPWEMTTEPRS